jgi:hypothetical protein
MKCFWNRLKSQSKTELTISNNINHLTKLGCDSNSYDRFRVNCRMKSPKRGRPTPRRGRPTPKHGRPTTKRGRPTPKWKAHAEAGKAYDEAGKAYDEAWNAYDEARKAYDEATMRYRPKLEALHQQECLDCPWDGKTIFPLRTDPAF